MRMRNADTKWAAELVKKNNVELIMIYDHWFHNLPNDWIKLGELKLGTTPTTAAGQAVSFYTVNGADIDQINQQLTDFASSLPDNTTFIMNQEINI